MALPNMHTSRNGRKIQQTRSSITTLRNTVNIIVGIIVLAGSALLILNLQPRQQLSSFSSINKLPDTTSKAFITKNQEYDTPKNEQPITIAYAISLIKCGDFQSSADGLSDAAIVLRHSVHLTSVRNPESGSRYDYRMYAIIHKDAEQCSQTLNDAGFHVIIKNRPVEKDEIQDENLRKNIHKEWCCGHDEFIKLYAYTIMDHPIVVHVDIDFIFNKPMDDLFDAMIYDVNTSRGMAARERIHLERPTIDKIPDRIDCFMTRDWPQVMPGRKAAYQAGFLMIRPSIDAFNTIINVIKTEKYVEGFGRDNGWGGKGYGALVGAMAMQGLLAYVYDEILPSNWVELNQCRYNHMGMDVLYRNQPGFRSNHPKVGKCRNDLDYCEDCMHTNITSIYNIHYTQCRKPWQCIGEGKNEHPELGKLTIPEDQVHLHHCKELITVWHSVRTDLENKLLHLTNDNTIRNGQNGTYKPEYFKGHCTGNGNSGYLKLAATTESLKRLPELY